MKKVIKTQYFQSKVEAGLYEYRGFDIWKDAARKVWTINGPKGGDFRLLSEAKAHVDLVIKYPHKRPKPITCQEPNSDSSISPRQK
jgi:hypothetical protein